jgi:hypothetical protein
MKVKLLVARRPNMFLLADDYMQFVGMSEIRFAFEQRQVNQSLITAYYPERYLNVQQQQNLINVLTESDCKEFRVVTTSVLIIQNVHSKDIRIPADKEDLPDKITGMCNRVYTNVDFDKIFKKEEQND